MNFLRKSRPATRSFFGGLASGAPPALAVPRPALPCSRPPALFGVACPCRPLTLPPHKAGFTNAMCLPGGKIIVFTGLLDHFRSDAEIATVIGHEVGHAIARHSAETITKNLWLAVLQLILFQFFAMPDLINAMSNLLLKLPFSRRMEMEADYIGLLLLASAGYDPRVAPVVYKKLGEITGDSMLRDYLSTHPSSKKRAELLSRAQVMGEALAIYREAIAGRGVEGFL